MNLYVIRHGETERNIKQLINGHNNGELTAVGIKQAEEASKIIGNLDLDLIFCSPLKRAKQTCEYVNVNKVDILYVDSIIERDAGDLEGTPDSNIEWEIWYDYTKKKIFNNTEGFKSVYDRVSNFFSWLKENYMNKNILLVTHGDVYKAIYLYFNPNLSLNEIMAYEKLNCEIEKFEL